jgi:hypothetical protein
MKTGERFMARRIQTTWTAQFAVAAGLLVAGSLRAKPGLRSRSLDLCLGSNKDLRRRESFLLLGVQICGYGRVL